MALTLLAGIWIISFSMLINTWITNAYLTTFIVTATALLPLILPQLFRFVWFLPFSYLDVAAMMRGTLIDRLNQPLASIWIGTGALFIWSVLNLDSLVIGPERRQHDAIFPISTPSTAYQS